MWEFEDPDQRRRQTQYQPNVPNNQGFGDSYWGQTQYRTNSSNNPGHHFHLTQFTTPLLHIDNAPGAPPQHKFSHSHHSYLNSYVPLQPPPQQHQYIFAPTPGPEPCFQFFLNDLSRADDVSMNMNSGGSQEETIYTKSMSGVDSWEMVPTISRSYSEISRETDIEGDEQFSTFSQGSGERIDMDVDMGGGQSMDMTQGGQNVLLGLGSPAPRQVFNPYQVIGFGAAIDDTYIGDQPGMLAFQPRTGKEQPWTPLEANVNPRMEAGLQNAAFAPSPGPAGEQDSEDILRGSPTAVKPPPRNSNAKMLSKRNRPNLAVSDNGWEHTVMRGEERVVMREETKEGPRRRHSGKRTGALAPQVAEKARRIRKLRACWSCWVSKVPCSEESICKRCSKSTSHTPFPHRICFRAGLKDFQEAFFPNFMHKHLQKEEVACFLAENVHCFREPVNIKVTIGQAFGLMQLTASIFEPKGSVLLVDHRLVPEIGGQKFQVVSRGSLPVGICGLSVVELKKTCKTYLSNMVQTPTFIEEVCGDDKTHIPRKILRSVTRYCASANVPLLRSALMLYATHFFMRRLLTFSDASVRDIHRTMNYFESDEEPEPYLSSRLLNRQIKHVISKIQQELTMEVLDGLEKSLRSRSKDSWAPSFCTILVLSLCIELIETAADIFVVCDIEKEGSKSEYRRNHSSEACSQLDNYPFRQCTQLFHDIFKSHRDNSGGKEGGLNPLMLNVETDGNTGWDQATKDMIHSIRSIIWDSSNEMTQLANNPIILNSDLTVSPDSIKANNSGRLVSKFLMSFYSI